MRTGLLVAGALVAVLLVWALGRPTGEVAPVGLAPIAILPSGDTEAPAPPPAPPAPEPAPVEPTAPTPSVDPTTPGTPPSPATTSPMTTSEATAPSTPTPAPVLLLVDAAAEMDAPMGEGARLDAVRAAVAQVVAGVPADLPLGLITAGDGGDATDGGRAESCSTVTTLARPGDLEPARSGEATAALAATGWRPLAAGLQIALPVLEGAVPDDLATGGTAGPPRLVVVASGADTCDRDPAAELADAGGRAVVDVIGLDVEGPDRDRLAALAAAGGGRYVDATDTPTLTAALDALVRGGLMAEPVVDRLVVDGRDVAALEVATAARDRTRGLLGRDGLDGAIWLAPAKQVHSIRMGFDLDVAFVAADGAVLRVQALPRNRLTPIVWRARGVVEAEAGRFATWGLVAGCRIAIPGGP